MILNGFFKPVQDIALNLLIHKFLLCIYVFVYSGITFTVHTWYATWEACFGKNLSAKYIPNPSFITIICVADLISNFCVCQATTLQLCKLLHFAECVISGNFPSGWLFDHVKLHVCAWPCHLRFATDITVKIRHNKLAHEQVISLLAWTPITHVLAVPISAPFITGKCSVCSITAIEQVPKHKSNKKSGRSP